MTSGFNVHDAAGYEQVMGRWSQKLAPLFIDFVGVAAGEKILDVGCGTGSLTFALARAADLGEIAAIDYSPVFVEETIRRNTDTRIKVRQADACALPFEDGTFDRALALLVLHFVPEAGIAVAEMRRVVRSGGAVAAAVWDHLGGMPGMRMMVDTVAALSEGGRQLRDRYLNTATLSLPPNILGFWTRCIRTTMHWSQEALAASANLTSRTIQRIEAGEPSSIATRRSLARGLAYENPDIFEDPEFIATVLKLLDGAQSQKVEDFHKQFPDHVPIAATPVKSGEALAALVGNSEASLFHCDDEISLEAKQQAACLFDYLHDLVDVWDDISFSDRLRYTQDMEQMLRELEGLDVRVHLASRSTKMVGVHWENKTPLPLSIGYLVVAPKDKDITQLMVPKRLS